MRQSAAWISGACREDLAVMDWSRAAAAYDWQLALERAALVTAVALAAAQRDDALLDVGTGTGGLLRELARRDPRPRSVIGVDASAAMLTRAPPLPAGWALQTADARQLPFADGAFSVVTVAYLLHVVDATTRRQIIGECRRVLRPGGRLVTVTPVLPRRRLARMLYRRLAAVRDSAVGPAAGLRPLDPRPELEHAGFTIAATAYRARGYPSLCVIATR